MAETPKEAQDPAEETPMTEDGIPLVVNGQRLSDVAIAALREARARKAAEDETERPVEVGGAKRPNDPTRYGDWEKAGRAIDFS